MICVWGRGEDMIKWNGVRKREVTENVMMVEEINENKVRNLLK